jgi:acetyl-CoA carboxylase biotin carboxyl carrier protein
VHVAEDVRAEMVANVGKIISKVGDRVAPGEAMVLLESMKMEIPVVSEDGGVVLEIAVVEGQVVQEGDLIVLVGD